MGKGKEMRRSGGERKRQKSRSGGERYGRGEGDRRTQRRYNFEEKVEWGVVSNGRCFFQTVVDDVKDLDMRCWWTITQV